MVHYHRAPTPRHVLYGSYLICHMQLAALYNESYSKYSRSTPTPTRDARL